MFVLYLKFMKVENRIFTILLTFLFICLFHFSGLGCLVRHFAKVHCPTCGMRRALFALLKLDIHAYFYYNAFALPVFLSLIVIIFSKHLHWLFFYFAISILCSNMIYYLYRVFHHSIP